MAILELVAGIVNGVESDTYLPFESIARQRIDRRDEDDWPVLASALALDCPIWTEDTDFFGCGVATWTTDRVELYLASIGRENHDGSGIHPTCPGGLQARMANLPPKA